MDDYVSVPLQDNESALPIARVSVPHVAFASVHSTEFSVVRIDDSSSYEVVPMTMTDVPQTTIFGL